MMASNKKNGMAALELMVVVVIILALFTVAIPVFLQVNPVDRIGMTNAKLLTLKQAIVGDWQKRANKARASFGFVGDVGVLPATLNDLLVQGAYPNFQTANEIWFGWRGPYIKNTSYLFDAWGNAIAYVDADGNPNTWDRRLYSFGPNETDNGGAGDDIVLNISEDEVRAYVRGDFLARDHVTYLTDETQLRVYYPNGAAGIASVDITPLAGATFPAPPVGSKQYDSQTDNVSDATRRKLPIGVRDFVATFNPFNKLAAINLGAAQEVNFYGTLAVTSGVDFELTFDGTDDTVHNSWASLSTPAGGSWIASGNGYLTNTYGISGGSNPTNYLLDFPTQSLHDDYRIEADVRLYDYPGYGIVYRWDKNMSGAGSPLNGYSFQYDPGHAGTGNGVDFVVYDWTNGTPVALTFLNQAWSSATMFNISHHISVTVQGNRTICKVDGVERLDFNDAAAPWLSGYCGLRIWRGGYPEFPEVRFYHVIIYNIPPLALSEIGWWSFEEGDGTTAYGSGFPFDAAENNGTITNGTRVQPCVYGQGLSFNNNGRVTVTDAAVLDPATQFTMEAWARNTNNNDNSRIVFKGVSGTRGNGIFQNNNNSPATGGWNAQVQTTNGLYTVCWAQGRPTINTWYHLVVTYDSAAVTFYVRDQNNNTYTASTPASGNLVANADNLLIGDSFRGRIDEVCYYSRALTAAQVLARFQKYDQNI